MRRSEFQRVEMCVVCGGDMRADLSRGFVFGSRGLLCYECAIQRGGRYDERHDVWVDEPRTDDLGRYYE